MSTVVHTPLSARLRPHVLDAFIGQSHLLGPDKPLSNMVREKQAYSMILWGPPGTGKTTLAKIIARSADAEFIALSAVLSGLKEVRAAIAEAKAHKQTGRKTILFVDEIHRFNKSQQDAFLPHVEDGTIILIGATTENPSFELNNALLSRVRVYVLKSHTEDDLKNIIQHALSQDKTLASLNLDLTERQIELITLMANGDARVALNAVEMLSDFAEQDDTTGRTKITDTVLQEVLGDSVKQFDKGGDWFYDTISALHKSVRGSNPDAALYWLSSMLVGGVDPLYVARRLIRIASEDVGNADPRALPLCLAAWDVQTRLGSPEGELAMAQAVTYLACCPKSNAVYTAFNKAWKDAKEYGAQPVPMHIRNAPTKLMKSLGMGKDYRYAHDEAHAYAAGETYLPEALQDRRYYEPTDRGLEKKIKEKLNFLRSLDEKAGALS